ncbi:alpha/beta fold hydrolase [Cystobacter ferrugineus]|uniref:alpha/beta fold hydrolase n=1 Tax=Cystobacter ferrugineus TaxID=83449 RepID=UPI00090442C6|nr:alpha/beta fold hydrolase [Cystobacter ferrugineus]
MSPFLHPPLRPWVSFLLLLPWLVLAGCALPAPTEGRLLRTEPTPVAEALFEVRARHTDLVPVRVVFPSDSGGRPLRPADGSRLPALVLVQGAFVPPEDYLWLAESLAARGHVVALPSHPLDFALSAADNGRSARQLLSQPPEGSLLTDLVDPSRIAVAGHSLGGVIASKLALEGGFAALALLASYPDPADAERVPTLAAPSLSLAGALDCSAQLPRVRDEASRLPSPSVLVVLQGVTHYQFTVSDQKDREGGCAPTEPLDTAHERITEVLARFLDAALSGQGTGADDLRQVPGTEVTVR